MRPVHNTAEVGPRDFYYVSRPHDLKPHNTLKPLHDGAETYPAMLAAMGAARSTIHLETYILADDATGNRFADVLIERARAGVTVRVIYDAWGSWKLGAAYVRRLTAAGIKIVQYNPIAPWRARFKLALLTRRDHRKILVVDARIAFTGGLNIANDYASEADGGRGWRDTHVQVEGPIVHDLERLFRKVWTRSGGDAYDAHRPAIRADLDGDVLAAVINNRQFTRRFRFKRAYLRAIDAAVERIDIMNAYFIPGLSIRRALKRAVSRGVVVRVMVPGNSDVKIAQYASGYLYARLLRAGVRIFEWHRNMMHAKISVIDGVWATIGSYNFDSQSLRSNLEVAVTAIDRKLGADLSTQFNSDVTECVEIEHSMWSERGWWKKLLHWCAYRARRLL